MNITPFSVLFLWGTNNNMLAPLFFLLVFRGSKRMCDLNTILTELKEKFL